MIVIARNVRTGQFAKVRLEPETIQKLRPLARYVIHPTETKELSFFVYPALAFCMGFVGVLVLL